MTINREIVVIGGHFPVICWVLKTAAIGELIMKAFSHTVDNGFDLTFYAADPQLTQGSSLQARLLWSHVGSPIPLAPSHIGSVEERQVVKGSFLGRSRLLGAENWWIWQVYGLGYDWQDEKVSARDQAHLSSGSSICNLFPSWLEVYANAPLCLVWGKEFMVGFPPVVKPRQAPVSPGLDTRYYLCNAPPRRPWRRSGQVQLLHLPACGQVYQAISGQSCLRWQWVQRSLYSQDREMTLAALNSDSNLWIPQGPPRPLPLERPTVPSPK